MRMWPGGHHPDLRSLGHNRGPTGESARRLPTLRNLPTDNWRLALEQITARAGKTKLVLAFDEFQWLVHAAPELQLGYHGAAFRHQNGLGGEPKRHRRDAFTFTGFQHGFHKRRQPPIDHSSPHPSWSEGTSHAAGRQLSHVQPCNFTDKPY